MDKCVGVIACVTILSELVQAGSYGGFDRHSQFHHSFEHPDPQRWHPGKSTWDLPESWRLPMHSLYHSGYRRQFFSGSAHNDKEYWHDHHPVINSRRHDWYQPNVGTGGHNDRYPAWGMGQWQWQSMEWNRPQGNRFPMTTTLSPVSSEQQIQTCIRRCPTTPEYNPVCGSNNVTYNNPGRLECARFCGVDVVLQRRQACSVRVQTTQAPFNTPPTRTTTTIPPITPPRPTIPTSQPDPPPRPTIPTSQPDSNLYPNIDLSIFGTTTTTTEASSPNPDDNVDVDIDIDIRTRGVQNDYDIK